MNGARSNEAELTIEMSTVLRDADGRTIGSIDVVACPRRGIVSLSATTSPRIGEAMARSHPAASRILDEIDESDCTATALSRALAPAVAAKGEIERTTDHLVDEGYVRRWRRQAPEAIEGSESMHRLTDAGRALKRCLEDRREASDRMEEAPAPAEPAGDAGAGADAPIDPIDIPNPLRPPNPTTPQRTAAGLGNAELKEMAIAALREAGRSTCADLCAALRLGERMKEASARSRLNVVLGEIVAEGLATRRPMDGDMHQRKTFVYEMAGAVEVAGPIEAPPTQPAETTAAPEDADAKADGVPAPTAETSGGPAGPIEVRIAPPAPAERIRMEGPPAADAEAGGSKLLKAIRARQASDAVKKPAAATAPAASGRAANAPAPRRQVETPRPAPEASAPARDEDIAAAIRNEDDATPAEIAAAIGAARGRAGPPVGQVAEACERMHRDGLIWARRRPSRDGEGPGAIAYKTRQK